MLVESSSMVVAAGWATAAQPLGTRGRLLVFAGSCWNHVERRGAYPRQISIAARHQGHASQRFRTTSPWFYQDLQISNEPCVHESRGATRRLTGTSQAKVPVKWTRPDTATDMSYP